jgi:hypothetical protein
MVSTASTTSAVEKPRPMISPMEALSSPDPPSRDLIEFLAFTVHAEDADVAGVMVPAGIDAAGDLDLQRADLLLPAGFGEALGNALGNRDGAGIGERAIIQSGQAMMSVTRPALPVAKSAAASSS